jgi:hypothetical protein
MRKTYVHEILTQIAKTAREVRLELDCEPMYRYNSIGNKKRILAAKDQICDLCSSLVDEILL